MNKDFFCDYYRMTGKNGGGVKGFFWLLLRYDLRYLYLIRQRKQNFVLCLRLEQLESTA